MPRPERVLDGSGGVVEQFAGELRDLRHRAGSPGYRTMAQATKYSATTLAEAAAGRRLPVLPVVLEYVRACGGVVEEWERRWRTAAESLAKQRDDGAADPPYRGLAVFEAADADRFFGRDALVEQLIEGLDRNRLVVVSGASGSGKSSLLRAGLMSAVTATGGRAFLLTPGDRPLEQLALADLGPDGGLLVVDQLEEAFTLCRDTTERAEFFHQLDTVATRHRVVVSVRADFLVECTRFPGLARAMSNGTVIVGPMAADGLRQAVAEPARRAGLTVERALVAQVLAEVEGRPGALALVSHALLETWRQRNGSVLTLAGYQAAGGVTGAVARTAERVWGTLTADQQRVARQLLLRLTALGDGTEDTRRRVARRELELTGIDTVIEAFAAARLIVVSADRIEFAHEAVLAAWPRLKGWLAEDRDALRTQRQLTEAVAHWESLGRDVGSLYRGARLALAREWAARTERRAMLNPAEAEFLDASAATEAAEHAAVMRRSRQLRRLSVALAAVLAMVTVLAGTALWQWRAADDQRRAALSRQLATQALSVAQTDVSQAMRLSVAAYSASPTAEARGALLSVASRRSFVGRLQHDNPMHAAAFSPDGGSLVTAGENGRIVVWDVARRAERARPSGHTSGVRSIAYSPDGATFVSGAADGSAILWESSTGTEIRRLHGHDGAVDGVAFSPDGQTLATIGADHRIVLWRVGDFGRITELAGHGGRDAEVTFTPDGRWLVSAGDDGGVVVWDLTTGTRLRSIDTGQPLNSVAVSPDGALVAAGGQGFQVLVWDLRNGRQVATLRGHTAVVSTVRFVDSGSLMTAGYDGLAALWDVRRGRRITNLRGSTSSLYGAAVSPDGRMFAAASRDRAVFLWDRSTPPMALHSDEVRALAVGVDGRTLASGDADNSVLLWPDADRSPGPPTALVGTATGAGAGVSDIALAADGRLLATADADKLVRLWDPTRPGTGPRTLSGHTDQVNSVAFHPDGRRLASGDADGNVRLWSLPADVTVAQVHLPAPVARVTFDRTGRTLVSSSIDGTIVRWDIDTRTVVATVRDPVGAIDLALHPDGRVAAVGRPDGTIALWDLAAGTQVAILRGHQGPVSAVAFSADGRFLASGSFDETTVLWRLADRRLWARLTGHGADVLSAAWSPNGDVLYTGSTDHTITAWMTDPAAARARICAELARAFPDTAAVPCPVGPAR
jgi:WD40 repeat protein